MSAAVGAPGTAADRPGPAAVAATTGPVRVVGTGLLGTSVGLALRAQRVDVLLADPSRTTLRLACDVGAGRVAEDADRPRLVVVAAPPDATPDVVLAELERFPGAVVTDVASVKSAVLDRLVDAGADLTRYVGSHPMAGSERTGPTAARPDLFTGRPWVVVPPADASPDAVLTVRSLATDVGATPVLLDARAHDDAVALVSHVPQVAASLVAARLGDAEPEALELAGQGLRDVTRIAASDPGLWTSILAANAGAVVPVLRGLREDLDRLLGALESVADGQEEVPGALGAVASTIAAGNVGVSRVPGKHGGLRTAYDVVTVLVPDRPGELARLLADVGAAGINLEELELEHAARRPVGLAALSVLRGLGSRLEDELVRLGWRLAG